MLTGFDKIMAEAEGKRVAVFLDYDGARSCVPQRGFCATESRLPNISPTWIASGMLGIRLDSDPYSHGQPAPFPASAGVF